MKRCGIVGLTMAAISICGCAKSPRDQAFVDAQEHARNAVGKAHAPVWDQMACTYGDKDQSPEIVTGYINGGKGAQLFLVTFDVDGKPYGEVELRPLDGADPGAVGYWSEVELDRRSRADRFCGVWKDLMGDAASIYWHAARDHLDPVSALKELNEARQEALKGEH